MGRLGLLFLTAVAASIGLTDHTPDKILLPVEVAGTDGTVVSRTVTLHSEGSESVRSLWLQVHGLRYAEQASIQINDGPWIPLDNSTVSVAEPGKRFGGIGGGFATLVMTLPLPGGAILAGANTIRFRFNRTDGVASAYRVLAFDFLTADGSKLLPPDIFEHEAPETWTPPLPDAASIQAGRALWYSAPLVASGLPDSPKIQAHCADCHAQDGRDLKYFNFSNLSIISRSRFHGLSALEGEQITSYIRSLPVPSPGRPWNPPYQPGPGLDAQPLSNWAAGAGLDWVLDQDTDALPFLFGKGPSNPQSASGSPDLHALVPNITPKVFRPDGNLNPREIPIALQLPDWSGWLPRIHPKDAWGSAFTQSEFAALYDGGSNAERKANAGAKSAPPLRALLAALASKRELRPAVSAFARWTQARAAFLKPYTNERTAWSPALTDKVYSAQLWQLVKTWEMMQEFSLEGRARDFFGPNADPRAWFNTIPADTAPSAANIPDGSAGVGGSALTNHYVMASWYELQLLLNSGQHQHLDRGPVDWVYVIGRFHDLHAQTHQPEPARLLVAVIKALQSTNPRLGPDDFRQGWRPEQNVDPRIMISPVWAPIFRPLPADIHGALTTALLAAWMDKNLQYPIAKYLPFGLPPRPYAPTSTAYGDITGGRVWESAKQFLEAGVPPDLVARLQRWGVEFTERAVRVQYEGSSRR
jgi:hypothetical protein